MTEEEYFRKYYPESCYGDKPLSPHWDFFQDGVEFGERQSEKKIKELEAENAEAKERIKTLEYRCENIKDTDTMELVALQRENAELKADNDARKFAMAMSEKVEKQLREENAELKEKQKWLGSSTKCWFSNSPCRSCDEHDDRLRRLGLCYIGQLTKAKEIIKKLLSAYTSYADSFDDRDNEIVEEAEQFLREVKK